MVFAKTPRIQLGLVGISGYAGYLGDRLVDPKAFSQHGLQLSAMYVPDPERHTARINELSSMGVRFHGSYRGLLEDDIQALWLPVPMHLHCSMTEAALRRGIAVMCEKPVATTIDDALSMLDTTREASAPALIGFQNIYEPATLELKKTILRARRGQPLHAVVTGGWPRGSHYYKRNNWAGSLRYENAWILDGPANNAMAHFINMAAYLLGPTPHESGTPVFIEAELYRANAIESYDTFSARVRFADGSVMTALLTHACGQEIEPAVKIMGDGIAATWADLTEIVNIKVRDDTQAIVRDVDPRIAMMQRLAEAAHNPEVIDCHENSAGDIPTATLQTSMAHTIMVNGAIQAAPIHTLPASVWHRIQSPELGAVHAIHGMESAIKEVSRGGKLLHELGRFAWTKQARTLNLQGYRKFTGPKTLNITDPRPSIVVKAEHIRPLKSTKRPGKSQASS